MPASVQAEFVSGNDLHKICQSKNYSDQGYCKGYVTGSVEALGLSHPDQELFCFEVGITKDQIVDVTKKYLLDNPEIRHTVATEMITFALYKGFPCGKSR